MSPVHVSSEIGRLRRALVHEPGPEVDRMVPAMMDELLFDDILYGDRARDEHARFRRVLHLCGIDVVDAADLLVETLNSQEAQHWVIDVLLADLGSQDRRALQDYSCEDLAKILVTGSRTRPHPTGASPEDLFEIPPLPNWCFQRDPQIVMGDGVVFSSMAAPARHREGLLARTIFRYHPELRAVPVLCDPSETDREHPVFLERERPNLEGGDVLILSPDVIAVGLSERTNRIAVKHLGRALARTPGGPRWLLAVDVPRRRAFMHLDTLITPVDRDACLVHAPVILEGGREQAAVFEMDLHADDPSFVTRGPLLTRLAQLGLAMEPIPCGGDDPLAQQREQWTDGANALAVAPGVITLYDRNLVTASTLGSHGFDVIEAEDLLLGRSEIDVESGKRVCILISSHEMSRARGGPHCLVHPLVRDRLS